MNMIVLPPPLSLLLPLFSFPAPASAAAFVTAPRAPTLLSATGRITPSRSRRTTAPPHVKSGEGDDGARPSPLFDPTGTGAGEEDWSNFNPFDPKSASSVDGGGSSTNTPAVATSLRSLRMKSITSDLYRNCNNPSKMDDILGRNEDFLIEQLVDLDSPLDVDSVFTSDMGAEERRVRYGEVMDERIRGAKSGEVRRILERLKDFVLDRSEARER